ncbi:MAG: hypothetical protein CL867_03140 [Cytophagaceae bacterium]|nr:hypothetical protein [Cytophagaceae bacterium]
MKRLFFTISILLVSTVVCAQTTVEDFFDAIYYSRYSVALEHISNETNAELRQALSSHLRLLKTGKWEPTLEVGSAAAQAKIIHLINQGIYAYVEQGEEEQGFALIREALEDAEQLGNPILAAACTRYILEIYERFLIVINDTSYNYFIDKLKQYTQPSNHKIADLYQYRIQQRFFFKDSLLNIANYKAVQPKLAALEEPLLKVKRDLTYFLHHQRYTRQLDSAQYYLDSASKALDTTKGIFENERKLAVLINQGSLAIEKGELKKGIAFLEQAEKQNTNDAYLFQSLDKYTQYRLYLGYQKLGDSLQMLKAHNAYLTALQTSDQAKNLQLVSEYETKYQTAEKEKQILVSEAQRKKNLNLAIGLGGSLLLGSIIALLVIRDIKRKQHLAEQAKALEIQKTEKVLKEKEIETINAMVAGQEKERQRLAGELHDNLGSTLATVRMQIENLERNLDKVAQPKTLLAKTHQLINEAYQKVRAISHERNAGVMATDGLLPAIERLAQSVSSKDGLQVSVTHFGLDGRLRNDIEITIFRIIQELITNIIKHAQATEAGISLTQFENELNILIEDNGKGFTTGNFQKNTGMGLGSIERRVEHLEGSLEVDSSPGRGTNIIIDLPL